MEKQNVNKQPLMFYKPATAICFISKGQLVNIPFAEIAHITKFADETVIYTERNQFVSYHSLQELLNELPVNDFFRVHRSHVINRQYVRSVTVQTVRINDRTIPVSGYFKQRLKDQWYELSKLTTPV